MPERKVRGRGEDSTKRVPVESEPEVKSRGQGELAELKNAK